MARALKIGPKDRQSVGARFWPKVARGAPDACWRWTAAGASYGVFWMHGANEGAHRVAFALAGGAVGLGQVVRHTCDNPPCCNPAHLLVGSYTENSLDRTRQGRGVGEDHPMAKLRARDVRTIRAARARGVPLRTLAQRFGVSRSTISMIGRRAIWRAA